jgi:hypothetical protein
MQGNEWRIRARAAGCVVLVGGACFLLTGGSLSPVGTLSPEERRLLEPLKGSQMMPWVERLCRPEFEGRKAGTPGAARAVEALSNHFRRLALEELPGAPGYRQPFTMSFSLLRSRWDRKAKLAGTSGGAAFSVPYPDYPSRAGSVRGEAVLVGHGIHRPDRGWDDYQNVNLKGKVAVFWGEDPPGIAQMTAARCRAAQARGASACVVIAPSDVDPNGEAIDRGVGRFLSEFPVIQLRRQSAAALFGRPVPRPARLLARKPGSKAAKLAANARRGPTGKSDPWRVPAASAKQLADTGAPAPESGSRSKAPRLGGVSVQIPASVDPARPLDNVLGVLPGSDPLLKEEWVIFSAHLDHMGKDGAAIFPGADDDASGVAVVCSVAEAFQKQGLRPRRSVLFALWNGEECGLLGSRRFVNKPLVPLEKTVGMLQLDMVGAGQANAFLTSTRNGPAPFYKLFESAARALSLSLPADNVKGVSDHIPFLRAGVPAIVATTAGVHPNYHAVGDRPSGVRPAALENCARLSALTLWRLANGEADATARKRSRSRLARR